MWKNALPCVVICLGIVIQSSVSAWLSTNPHEASSQRRSKATFAAPGIINTERRRRTISNRRKPFISRYATPIIDADFERIERNLTEMSARGGDTAIKEQLESKSLLQIALEADPDWNQTRIPFMDGENFIDVKLAFMAELDGVQYGIGIPFDHAAAVTIEEDGQVVALSPDDPDSEEMIQIMADQLQEHVGKDLSLKRTPRILTIQGPLESYTSDWREKVVSKPIDTKTLLDDSDEDLKYFHDFMRKELGEDEYKKTLNESPSDDARDFFDLFEDVSTKSVEDLFSDINDDKDDLFIQEMENFVNKDIQHDGVALKLLSYSLEDGKKYSVVHPESPVAMVAKFTDDEDDVRFDLLSPKDADILIPRLEKECLEDLEQAGLTGDNLAK